MFHVEHFDAGPRTAPRGTFPCGPRMLHVKQFAGSRAHDAPRETLLLRRSGAQNASRGTDLRRIRPRFQWAPLFHVEQRDSAWTRGRRVLEPRHFRAECVYFFHIERSATCWKGEGCRGVHMFSTAVGVCAQSVEFAMGYVGPLTSCSYFGCDGWRDRFGKFCV